jgi:hypothetical protein
MFDFELLAQIDHAMTMIDVDLMEWQGHLDMAALACLDLTVYETEPAQMELPFPLTVKRVPLTKGFGGPVIGIADVDLKAGVMRAEIDDQYKELIGFPDAFSIREDDPPLLDHKSIKAQLKNLIDPELYRNPYSLDTMALPGESARKSLKMMINGEWIDIAPEATVEPLPIDNFRLSDGTEVAVDEHVRFFDNHPFFKEID